MKKNLALVALKIKKNEKQVENIEDTRDGYPFWISAQFLVEAFQQRQDGERFYQYEPKQNAGLFH